MTGAEYETSGRDTLSRIADANHPAVGVKDLDAAIPGIADKNFVAKHDYAVEIGIPPDGKRPMK